MNASSMSVSSESFAKAPAAAKWIISEDYVPPFSDDGNTITINGITGYNNYEYVMVMILSQGTSFANMEENTIATGYGTISDGSSLIELQDYFTYEPWTDTGTYEVLLIIDGVMYQPMAVEISEGNTVLSFTDFTRGNILTITNITGYDDGDEIVAIIYPQDLSMMDAMKNDGEGIIAVGGGQILDKTVLLQLIDPKPYVLWSESGTYNILLEIGDNMYLAGNIAITSEETTLTFNEFTAVH
jgi:hypothetical protein